MSTRRSGLFVIVGSVVAGLAGLGLYRAGVPAAPPTSVAVVNIEKLMNASAEAKSRADSFNKYVEPFEKELATLGADFENKRKELDLLPKGSKDARAKFVEAKKLEAQIEVNKKLYKGLADLQKGEMFRTLYESATAAVQRVAKLDGYQLVLLDDREIKFEPDLSPAQVGTVIQNKRILFAEDAIDITERVLTDMNNAFNAPAPKSGAAK